MEELEKAVESYTKALEIDQSSTAAHNNLGNLMSKLNNPEAEYHYKKLIELMGNEVFPRLNMSNYLIRNQRYDDAIKYNSLNYKEVLDQELRVMDLTAITLCKENKLPLVVYDINEKDSLVNLINGQNVGTVVS